MKSCDISSQPDNQFLIFCPHQQRKLIQKFVALLI